MAIIIFDDFTTKLGTISIWIETESSDYTQQQNKAEFITTAGYSIYLQPFDSKQIWILEQMECESVKGWRWFIRKTNNQKEQLTIFCKLINSLGDTKWGANSGQYLDAIEIEDGTHQLHIGTEDGEMMHDRAESSDWMPERLKDEVNFHKSFTEYIDFGFKTTVPELSEGESIYFHFITAINIIKPSEEYPSERDMSTWFAVDQSKKGLDANLINPLDESEVNK